MCLAQGHKTVMPVRLEPAATRSQVKHSATALPKKLVYALRTTHQLKNVAKRMIILECEGQCQGHQI